MTTPQTHRPLSEGEIIQEGDEYQLATPCDDRSQNGWVKTDFEQWGVKLWKCNVGHFRRPLPAQQHGETPTPRTDAAEREYEEYKAVCLEIEMGGGKTLPESKPDGWDVARQLETEFHEQRQQWRISTVCRGVEER